MDFNIVETINANIEVSTVLFCIVVGYIYNNYTSANNKHLPTLVAILGVFFSSWNNGFELTPHIVLTGAISGLASTGLHQVIKQYFFKNSEEK